MRQHLAQQQLALALGRLSQRVQQPQQRPAIAGVQRPPGQEKQAVTRLKTGLLQLAHPFLAQAGLPRPFQIGAAQRLLRHRVARPDPQHLPPVPARVFLASVPERVHRGGVQRASIIRCLPQEPGQQAVNPVAAIQVDVHAKLRQEHSDVRVA